MEKKSSIRNKVIIIILVLFAPMLVAHFAILVLLSKNIINVFLAVVLTAIVIACIMVALVYALWSFLTPIISVFFGDIQKNVDNKMTQKIQKLSTRDDGVGELLRSANSTVTGLAEIIKGIQNTIGELESVSVVFDTTFHGMEDSMQDTTVNINTITDNTMSQVDNIHDMKAKIDAISVAVENINENVKALAQSAVVVENCQRDAGQIMDELTSMSKESGAAIEEVKNQTDRTNKSAQQIHTAAEIIADISSQTNLLALNASIEAARAGEHGRGFAVVAEEIGQLADQSKESTQQINNIVNELLANSHNSVEITERVLESFMEQNKKVEETSRIFKSLNTEVTKVGAAIQDIETKVTELDDHKNLIAGSTDAMTSFADENARQADLTSKNVADLHEMVGECTNIAKKIVSVSDDLAGYVKRFEKKRPL